MSKKKTKEPNRQPCIAPGCRRQSKGPRFHFLCEDHMDAPTLKILEWQAIAKKKRASK